ncbi:unnamed protein product, partial [Cuscuta europaea]
MLQPHTATALSTVAGLFLLCHICSIEDHHTNTMIGYADLKNGLYLYNSTDSSTHNKSATVNHVHSQCSDSKYDIWHYRLGHLPFNKLNAIVDCNVSHHINKDTACDICHFAKQK